MSAPLVFAAILGGGLYLVMGGELVLEARRRGVFREHTGRAADALVVALAVLALWPLVVAGTGLAALGAWLRR